MGIKTLVGLLLTAAPLVVLAQNANTPGGQASTGSAIDQTKTSSQQRHSTSRRPRRPSDGMAGTTGGTMAKSKSKPKTKSGNTTQPGDVPTYPAPAPDGTPTK